MRRFWCFVLVVALGCGRSEEEYQLQVRRISELREELEKERKRAKSLEENLAELERRNQELVERLEALGHDLEALRVARTSLVVNLSEAQRALEVLREGEARERAREALYRQLLERFRAMTASGRLRVRIVRNRMVVELPDTLLFEPGEAKLKSDGKNSLHEVLKVLQTIDGCDFQVAGHTDDAPIHSRHFPSNWELSAARAVAVVRFLIENGISPGRLSAVGHADTQPADTNETPEG
ncbi:MAG: OmpA family protein, partial [Deltaproteobacteria bacterium]|nr:OmpA family protein [Deltaproteobacteria bacterium]